MKKIICFIVGHRYCEIALQHGWEDCERCCRCVHCEAYPKPSTIPEYWQDLKWRLRRHVKDPIRHRWQRFTDKFRKPSDDVPF